MVSRVFTDNARSYLLSSITEGGTTLVLPAGQGALFATPPAGKWQDVTLDDGEHIEICRMTARSGDALTVLRGQDGTAARAWPAGAPIAALVTAAALNDFGSGGGSSLLKIRIAEGVDYTLTADDESAFVDIGGDEVDRTVWVPHDDDVDLPVGCRVFACRGGFGAPVKVEGLSGVTIKRPSGYTEFIAMRGGVVRLVKITANTWRLFGDLELA